MKYIEKSKIAKKHLLAVILALTFALVLAASILIPIIAKDKSSGEKVYTPVPLIEGEARQNGLTLAYPSIRERTALKLINVKNQVGEYGFLYDEEEGHHILYYIDSNGEQQIYYPDICAEDPSFEYTSLFAIETKDGFGQFSVVNYLCLALQSAYFDVRIPIDPEKREEQLKNYGFVEGEENTVSFVYKTELGATVNRKVRIGEKSVTGTGYYFIVYDNGVERPYIYSSLNNYYDYAVSSMNRFVKPLLVSDGLAEDNGFGPYLTTGYYQWLNEYHDGSCECDKYECECGGNCESEDCSCSDECRVTVIEDGSKVIAYTDTISPIISEDSSSMGIESTGSKLIEIDLWSYKEALEKLTASKDFVPSYESENYERVIAALTGKSIGDYSENEIVFSLVAPKKLIDFADKDSVKYDYKITSVDAIVTDSGELTAVGLSAGDEYNLVKVTYTAALDGKAVSLHPMHAVLDLSGSAIDESTRESIKCAEIGDELDISFTVEYTSKNAIMKNGKCIITEIIDIYDEKGNEIDTVTETSMVGYRYEVYVDGVSMGEATYWVDLSEVTEEIDIKIKNVLVGKKLGKASFELDEYNSYYEYFLDFQTQKISKIDSFVTRELVSAFRFQNSSLRDPYYGESIYENLMTNEHRLYGLNFSVCEKVVQILGGLSNDSATATAAGLAGDEVFAIGLTPEVMKEYGLYAHTVYFELPRGIKAHSPGSTNKGESLEQQLDDYTFRSTLGFNLYVSDVDHETNTRYIASDLYGIVTRVSADDFVFLNYDFETFWARRYLILVDITQVDKYGVEFNMADLKGGYTFELLQPSSNKDALGVHVTTHGECTPNKFTEFISDPKNESLIYNGGTSLKTFYLYASDADEKAHEDALPETLGSYCFKELVQLLYFTSYTSILPDEIREEEPDPETLVMKMTVQLREDVPNASPYTYVYGFYRIDDRRVRVSIHQESTGGQVMKESVSDFYISTYAFKKIVSNFLGVLNAEVLDIEVGYPDEKK